MSGLRSALLLACLAATLNAVVSATEIADGPRETRHLRGGRGMAAVAAAVPVATVAPVPPLAAADVNFFALNRETFRSQFTALDFKYDLQGSLIANQGAGGVQQRMDVEMAPSLFGEGISLVLTTLNACGIGVAHTHPRASEVQYVITSATEGVQTTLIQENGITGFANTVTTGQVSIFPQGLVHYARNLGCTPALLLSALNSEDPGVLNISNQALPQLAAIPDGLAALAAQLGVDEAIIAPVPAFTAGTALASPTAGIAACYQKCGIIPPAAAAVVPGDANGGYGY